MNGPEHWREADLILTGDPCEYGCPHSGCPHEVRMIVRALAHGVLALGTAEALARAEERIDGLEERLENVVTAIEAIPRGGR